MSIWYIYNLYTGTHSDKCDGKTTETENKKCPNHCPAIGWGAWESWGTCRVTCGTAPQTRIRKCLDEVRSEVAEVSPCKGKREERDTRTCDMGECGEPRTDTTTQVCIDKNFYFLSLANSLVCQKNESFG